MTLLHSIPPPHVQATVTYGALNSPDWWIWLAYGLVLTLAACFMPTGLRESCRALWEPWKGWIAGLSALLVVLTVLVAFTCWEGLVDVFCWLARPPKQIFKPLLGRWSADTGLRLERRN